MIDRELYLPAVLDRATPTGSPRPECPTTSSSRPSPRWPPACSPARCAPGCPARWVTGDEVYGADPEPARRVRGPPARLRAGHRLRPPRPHRGRPDPRRRAGRRAAPTGLAATLGRTGRQGSALLRLGLDRPHRPRRQRRRPTDTECWWLLIRRHRDTGELAFYRCYSPAPVPLRELVRVAGRRWSIEESFQAGKGLAGLDEHQVRRWTSWRRWTLLAMIAHALLAVLAATSTPIDPHPPG